MKAAAVAIQSLLARFVAAVGLEGAFLVAGVAFLSRASLAISPDGPWFVIGASCFLAGLALALPRRT